MKQTWKCLFGVHFWEVWKETGRGLLKEENRCVGSFIKQERSCVHCGLTQLRVASA